MKCQPNIFTYTDYRKFLSDWYAFSKETKRHFSFRLFSMKAGFFSPNFLKRVIDGERNLTLESILKCAHALDLNKQETDFFKNLVLYNQSDDEDEKKLFYKKLIQSQKLAEIKPLEKELYEYFSNWYHPVIRESVTHPKFDGSPQWIASRVKGNLTVRDVEKSIALLIKLGLIEKTKKGYVQKNTVLTTGAETREMAILEYHTQALEATKGLMRAIPQDLRDVSSLILGVKKSRLKEIKDKVVEFRRELLKLVEEDTQAEEVILLNMQLLRVL